MRYLLYFAADVALVGVVVHCIVMCLLRPIDVVQWEQSFGRRLQKTIGPKYLAMLAGPLAYALCLLVGLGIIIHSGTTFLFSWLPRGWVDGDGMWLGEFFSSLLTFAGVGGLLGLIKDSADRRYELEAAHAVQEHSRAHFEKQLRRLTSIDPLKLPQVLREIEEEIAREQKQGLTFGGRVYNIDLFASEALLGFIKKRAFAADER